MADARQQGGIPYSPRESSGCGFYNAKPYMTQDMTKEAYEAHVRRCQELAANAAAQAQQVRAPGKMFSRETIVAILRGHLALATARPTEMNERDAIRALITVFENLE